MWVLDSFNNRPTRLKMTAWVPPSFEFSSTIYHRYTLNCKWFAMQLAFVVLTLLVSPLLFFQQWKNKATNQVNTHSLGHTGVHCRKLWKDDGSQRKWKWAQKTENISMKHVVNMWWEGFRPWKLHNRDSSITDLMQNNLGLLRVITAKKPDVVLYLNHKLSVGQRQ